MIDKSTQNHQKKRGNKVTFKHNLNQPNGDIND